MFFQSNSLCNFRQIRVLLENKICIKKGMVFDDLFLNIFELEDVLKEFGFFNLLEQYVVVLNILFIKMFGLLKGGFNGMYGFFVYVLFNLKNVIIIFLRLEDESFLLKVKLERKLKYEGYKEY